MKQWGGLTGLLKAGVYDLLSATVVALKLVTADRAGGLLQLSSPGVDSYKWLLLPITSQIGDMGNKHRDSACVY